MGTWNWVPAALGLELPEAPPAPALDRCAPGPQEAPHPLSRAGGRLPDRATCASLGCGGHRLLLGWWGEHRRAERGGGPKRGLGRVGVGGLGSPTFWKRRARPAPPPMLGEHVAGGVGVRALGGLCRGRGGRALSGRPVCPSACTAAWGLLSAAGVGRTGSPSAYALTFTAYCSGRGRHRRSGCACVCERAYMFRVFLKQLCSCAQPSLTLRWELGTWLIAGLFWAWRYRELHSVSVRKQRRCRLSRGVLDAPWEAGPRVRWGPWGLSEWQGGHLPGAAPFRPPMGPGGLAWGVLPRPRSQGLLCRELPP